MRKGLKIFLGLVVVLALLVMCLLIYQSAGPKDVKLEKGWQLIQIDGRVPKGAIVIVNEKSNARLPNENPETKRVTGYITQGRVNFHEAMWMVTDSSVWVYFPEDYEFIQKKYDFSQTCLEKLSSLIGKEVLSMDEYDVGH